jgi:hypothetical protein
MGSSPCCICLEGPEKEAMFLIACGCKGGWFHGSCEDKWVDTYKYPYSCPTCRRPVPFKTVYSFLSSSGEEQKFLQRTLKAIVTEIFLFGFQEKTSFLPSQTIAILTMPFIIRSNHTLPDFLRCILVKNICQYILLGFTSNEVSLNLVKYMGFVYIGLMYFSHYTQYMDRAIPYIVVDPLQPYAIYREVIHADSITQSPPDTLEGS